MADRKRKVSTRRARKASLPDLTSAAIAEAKCIEDELLIKRLSGLMPFKQLYIKPCAVKILIVVDTTASFNRWFFGLSEVLATLQQNPEWWVNFEVHRAHRQVDPNPPSTPISQALSAPTYENFRFDQSGFDINYYNQIWFFGLESDDSAPPADTSDMAPGSYKASHLAQNELEMLYAWMDRGGGVFAAGDHDNMGSALCGDIPRVRNMRKWKHADNPPPVNGLARHDTLLKGHDYGPTEVDESDQYTDDDESDDVPMRIRPRWYWQFGYSRLPYQVRRRPHPILCGKEGVIDVLPDHPHEGEVIVGQDLELKGEPRPGGYASREFPDYGGRPLAPEIIAWAKVQGDHADSEYQGKADAREFGCIGAYNGHSVDVGRVVTDSTWHHWFDLNLSGRMAFGYDTLGNIETGDPRKASGFYATEAGRHELSRIKNYFRNVAIWLAPIEKQRCMALRMLWGALCIYPLVEELDPKLEIVEIGSLTLDALDRLVGTCTSRSWKELWLPDDLHFAFKAEGPLDRLGPAEVAITNLEVALVGSVIKNMLEYKEKKGSAMPSDRLLNKMVESGIKIGLNNFLKEIAVDKRKLSSFERLVKSQK